MRASLRVVVFVLTLILSSMAFAVAPQAAPGPGPGPGPASLPAGSYHFTTLRANFIAGTYPNQQFSLYVTHTTRVSTPLGGPTTTVSDIQLYINTFSPYYASYCYAPSPSDFSVASGLSAATLTTTITATTPLCPYSSNNLPGLPVTFNVTWTGSGPIAKSQSNDEFKCGSYSSESTMAGMNNVGSATANVTPMFPNPLSATQAGFGSNDQQISAEGVSLDSCPPAFGGKGTGFGPQPPGSYRFVSLQAGANFQLNSGQMGVYVSNFTNTLRPDAGPATVTHEIHVTIFIFTGSTSGFMCFVIPDTDFTSTGVQTAALHTTVGLTTTQCGGPSFGSLPLPLTLDLSWTGLDPVATLNNEGVYSCDTFSTEGESVSTTNNNVTIAGTVTPASTGNLTTTQGSLVTGDSRVEIKGVQSQACLIRG